MGCATRPAQLQVTIPDSFKAACVGPSTEGVRAVGDLAAFSIKQEAALADCDAKRSGLLSIVEGVNVKEKKRLWPF